MFTLADIRTIAIQIEKNGEETYRNAGKAAKDPEVAKTLTLMAEEEKCHANWFTKLVSNTHLTAEQRELEQMGRTLLQDMIKGNNFLIDEKELINATSVAEVIARSKAFELDTILFYEFLIEFLDDPEAIGQLRKIITEERSHIEKLEQMEDPSGLHKPESTCCQ